jgi:hypothetical protein
VKKRRNVFAHSYPGIRLEWAFARAHTIFSGSYEIIANLILEEIN